MTNAELELESAALLPERETLRGVRITKQTIIASNIGFASRGGEVEQLNIVLAINGPLFI